MKGKAVAMLTLLLVAGFMTLPMAVSIAADAPTINLYNGDGEKETVALLHNSVVEADTDITPSGIQYIVPAISPIDVKGAYLIMASDLPFTVSIAVSNLSGWIVSAGMVASVCEDVGLQEVKASVCLDETNGFIGTFDPVLESDKKYYISLTTAYEYVDSNRPAKISDIEISFSINSADYHLLTFVSEDEVVETKVLKTSDPVGDLPIVSKEGYILDGWFAGDSFRVSSTTLVSDLPEYTITAKWIEDEPEPDPPSPPEPEDKYTRTVEEIEEDDHLTEIITETLERVDGTKNV